MGAITDFLITSRQADSYDPNDLYSMAYDALRRIAAHRLGNGSSLISPTELVHEAWIRLSTFDETVPWETGRHFFHAAAEAMRNSLVDLIRHQNRIKRGANFNRVDLRDDCSHVDPLANEILGLNEALEVLEASHPEKAEIVKLKFFAGMTIEEISKATGYSAATVERYWAYAKAWLHRQMAI